MINLPPHSRETRALSKLSDADKEAIGRYIRERVNEGVRRGNLRVMEYTLMAAIVTLIERFGFGTATKRGTGRIERFVDGFHQTAQEYGEAYDEAAYEAMRLHLRELGVETETKEGKDAG